MDDSKIRELLMKSLNEGELLSLAKQVKDLDTFCTQNKSRGYNRVSISGGRSKENIIFSLGEIHNPFHLSSTASQKSIFFRDCVFSGKVELESLLSHKVIFERCIFNDVLILSNYNGRIYFSDCELKKDIKLERSNLIKVRFKDCKLNLLLNDGQYSKCKFLYLYNTAANTDFFINANFINLHTIFLFKCTFGELRFSSRVSANIFLKDNKISSTISFSSANVEGRVLVTNSLSSSSKTKLEIANSQFKRPVMLKNNCFSSLSIKSTSFAKKIILNDTHVGDFHISNSNFGDDILIKRLRLTNCEFLQNTNFHKDFYFQDSSIDQSSFLNTNWKEYCAFSNCSFDEAPFFEEATFTTRTTFRGSSFKDIKSTFSEGRYRRLKSYMHEIGNDYDANIFASRELASGHKDLDKKHIFEWFLSWMYFFINDYGRSLFKPVIGLLVVYISFALLFNFTDSFFIENSYLRNRMHNTQSEIFSSDSLPEVMHDLDWLSNLRFESRHKQVLVFSSVNMLGPLRLLGDFTSFKYKRTRYLFLSWLQAILSTILWYTFIVGIKRRFKTN